jgi:surface carbohydrate biosynthesis protein (TIGR04326 family)
MSDLRLVVWDLDGPAHEEGDIVCAWKGCAEVGPIVSIPELVEKNGQFIRERYAEFIHGLGMSKLDERSVIDHLSLSEDFSFWWMSLLAEKSALKSSSIFDCLKLLALEQFLLEQGVSECLLATGNKALAKSVRILCCNLNIDFKLKWVKPPTFLLSAVMIYNALPFFIQGLVYLVKRVGPRWKLRKLNGLDWNDGPKSLFFCSYFIHLDLDAVRSGQFSSHQWGPLPDLVRTKGKTTNWLHHFLDSSLVSDSSSGLGLLNSLNKNADLNGQHAFLDSFLSWKIILRILTKYVRSNFLAWRLRGIAKSFHHKNSSASLWYLLRSDWNRSLRGPVAVSNFLVSELFEAALKVIPRQNVGLYLCENQGWERAFIRSWRKNGHGLLIAVPHATVRFWDLRFLVDRRSVINAKKEKLPLPDLVALNGPAAWQAYEDAGYPTSKLVEAEALRYLELANIQSRETPARIEGPYRALILGDIMSNSTVSMLELLDRSVSDLILEYDFTLKAHPATPIETSDYPSLSLTTTNEALHRILGDFDMVIVSNGSSAALDVRQSGLELIVHVDWSELNNSPLRDVQGVVFVRTQEELVSVLNEVPRNTKIRTTEEGYFYLDQDLPRWRRLLQLNEELIVSEKD